MILQKSLAMLGQSCNNEHMTTTNENRFGVRVGDDGSWHGKYATIRDARDHARTLSADAGMAQIMEFVTGTRESWRDGEILNPGRFAA